MCSFEYKGYVRKMYIIYVELLVLEVFKIKYMFLLFFEESFFDKDLFN